MTTVQSLAKVVLVVLLCGAPYMWVGAAFAQEGPYASTVTDTTVLENLNPKESRLVFDAVPVDKVITALATVETLESVELYGIFLNSEVIDALASHEGSIKSLLYKNVFSRLSSSVVRELIKSTTPERLVLDTKFSTARDTPDEPLPCPSVTHLVIDDWALFKYASFHNLEELTVIGVMSAHMRVDRTASDWADAFPSLLALALVEVDHTAREFELAAELSALLSFRAVWTSKYELEVDEQTDKALGRIARKVEHLALDYAPGNAEQLWLGIAESRTLLEFELDYADGYEGYCKAVTANESISRVSMVGVSTPSEFLALTSSGRDRNGTRHYHLPTFSGASLLGQFEPERLSEMRISGRAFGFSSTDELRKVFLTRPGPRLALSPAWKMGPENKWELWMDEKFIDALSDGLKTWPSVASLSLDHWWGKRPFHIGDVLPPESSITRLSLPSLDVPDKEAVAEYRELLSGLEVLHVRSVANSLSWELICGLDNLESLAIESLDASLLSGSVPQWPKLRTMAIEVAGPTEKINAGMDYIFKVAVSQKLLKTLALGAHGVGHSLSSFKSLETESGIERLIYCSDIPADTKIETILKTLPALRLLEYSLRDNLHLSEKTQEAIDHNPSLTIVDHPYNWSLDEMSAFN